MSGSAHRVAARPVWRAAVRSWYKLVMLTYVVIAGFVAFLIVVLQTILHLRYLRGRDRKNVDGVCMRCGKPLDNTEPSLVCPKCGEPIIR